MSVYSERIGRNYSEITSKCDVVNKVKEGLGVDERKIAVFCICGISNAWKCHLKTCYCHTENPRNQ